MLKKLFLLLIIIAGSKVYATHNLAGDITYKHIDGLTYEVTVTIFTDGNSTANTRKSIQIDWGDGRGLDSLFSPEEIQVGTTGQGIPVLKRTWKTLHTFPGANFTYLIRVEDPNRNDNVINIANSIGVPFTIESELTILSGQENNSVQLRNDPLDQACAGALFIYNPGAFDPDGIDSLAYRIAKSKGANGSTAGFTFPVASDSIVVDPINGDLIWRNPVNVGIYNVAILIIEYRNGVEIGSVLRDIQIYVEGGCQNVPPQILSNNELCAVAGENIVLNITSNDADNDDVTLSATGEVLEDPIDVRTSFSTGVSGNPTNATFTWSTNCSDVRLNKYNLSIKAEDNASERPNQPSTNLANFKTVSFRIVSPGPSNATATNSGRVINLSWDNLDCPEAKGYNIYRRFDSSGYVSSNCIVGVPANLGYQKIAVIEDINITSFTDDGQGEQLIPGREYCYLITKYFVDGDESYVSNETCAEIDKVVPIITNVSVINTDTDTGKIFLAWSPPIFDSTAFPPPYRYIILKQDDANNLIAFDSTNSLIDTTAIDQLINTDSIEHSYRIDLYSLGNGRQLMGKSSPANSIFLSVSPSDELNFLTWTNNVPWKNNEFIIYRKLASASSYDSIATINSTNYVDSNLINGINYCYYIQSTGSYNLTNVINPIINLSQEACGTPVDNVPPCTPSLTLNANCENGTLRLNWPRTFDNCAMDIAGYVIYRALTIGGEFKEFDRVNSPTDTSYFNSNDSVGGCYAIAAFDSTGNIGGFSNTICTEFCPIYELPNVFTPNGDGINDLFIPIQPYRYVDSIELKIFNRWGEIVFETNDPDIKWSGTHESVKVEALKDLSYSQSNLVSSGVFFYICKVFELSLNPQEPRILKGTVTVLDNTNQNNNALGN